MEYLCNFVRGYYEEYLELGPEFQEMLFMDISYLKLWQPFCLAEENHLCNIGRRHLIVTTGASPVFTVCHKVISL